MAFKAEADFGVARRDEWSYAPAVGVGPLRFGMTVDEVVEAAEMLGQTKVSDCARGHAIFSRLGRSRSTIVGQLILHLPSQPM
ncbi:hypothetical protein [Streptomyces sp. WAC00263]|uniref:hypothetical protein n=1 Tax=Streptomyces sp. WAC00263 TaxID=1917422 RepID=UPI0015EF98B5|nr:hypothetical protein [Streptomyces sp. WAC00263]KAF5990230.1 hypothetical protein BOG92_054550 [Streptomyces sp. WAC00263]